MANYTNLNDLFTAIANAIRNKTNSIDSIVADNFPDAIENLKTGFDYNNSNVTEIPDYAFYGCENLKSVDCTNLTTIGISAFENCTNLKSVILHEGIENIGENAELYLNGRHCGMRICPPYAFDITEAVREKDNELLLKVYTTLANSVKDPVSMFTAIEPTGAFGKVRIKIAGGDPK